MGVRNPDFIRQLTLDKDIAERQTSADIYIHEGDYLVGEFISAETSLARKLEVFQKYSNKDPARRDLGIQRILIQFLAASALRMERPKAMSFVVDHDMYYRMWLKLDTAVTFEHLHYLNLIQLAYGQSLALNHMEQLPRPFSPHYAALMQGRIALMKGETWTAPEIQKQQLIWHLKPYIELIEAATHNRITGAHLAAVDEVFVKVNQVKGGHDDYVMGNKTDPMRWDASKCAILDAAGILEDAWGEHT